MNGFYNMKNVLEYIITAIVTDSEKVVVEEKETNGIVEFTIYIPKEEIGKIIGKNGKVIRAIRNVLKIAAIKQQKKIHITLQEQ